MTTPQLIEEIGAIFKTTVAAAKSTSLSAKFSAAFNAGLKSFATAFIAAFVAPSESNVADNGSTPL